MSDHYLAACSSVDARLSYLITRSERPRWARRTERLCLTLELHGNEAMSALHGLLYLQLTAISFSTLQDDIRLAS